MVLCGRVCGNTQVVVMPYALTLTLCCALRACLTASHGADYVYNQPLLLWADPDGLQRCVRGLQAVLPGMAEGDVARLVARHFEVSALPAHEVAARMEVLRAWRPVRRARRWQGCLPPCSSVVCGHYLAGLGCDRPLTVDQLECRQNGQNGLQGSATAWHNHEDGGKGTAKHQMMIVTCW